MTNAYHRRIRKLEAIAQPEMMRFFVFGLPGRADPNPADIGPADMVIRLNFVPSPKRASAGGSNAVH